MRCLRRRQRSASARLLLPGRAAFTTPDLAPAPMPSHPKEAVPDLAPAPQHANKQCLTHDLKGNLEILSNWYNASASADCLPGMTYQAGAFDSVQLFWTCMRVIYESQPRLTSALQLFSTAEVGCSVEGSGASREAQERRGWKTTSLELFDAGNMAYTQCCSALIRL